MKTKSSVKSGGQQLNHNQSTAGVKVQSNVKAGGFDRTFRGGVYVATGDVA